MKEVQSDQIHIYAYELHMDGSNEMDILLENVDQLVWKNLLPDSSYLELLFLVSGVVHD